MESITIVVFVVPVNVDSSLIRIAHPLFAGFIFFIGAPVLMRFFIFDSYLLPS